MGRTRVPPESRRRSQRACNFCRSSKKKCDGVLPCSNCKRRGRQASCNFAQFLNEQEVRGPPSLPPPPSRASADTDDGHPQSSTPFTAPVPPYSSVPTTSYPTPDTERDTSSCGQQMQPRMLRNGAGGERVYIGSSAAISFLQFVRVTLRRCAGPSAFTESRTRHMLLEASVGAGSACEFDDDLDQQTKASLVKSFLQASSGFLGLFTDEDISQLLSETIEVPNPPRPSGTTTLWSHAGKRTALYLILAIGARCGGSTEQDRRCSAMYFTRAQEMAFRDMLLDPSLDMAINFLLMAFYMFCASRRNTALLYLGISSKAATILGLHLSELNREMPRDVMDFRARIWASLRVLDLHGNGILGRPSSTDLIGAPSTADAEEAETKAAAHRTLALKANFELCSIVEVISKALTKNKAVLDEVAAEGYLKMLRDWAQALPEELRRSIRKERREGVPEWVHREHTIGNVHVACSYYFAVIIATRPFLVATVLPRLLKQQSAASRMASPSPGPSGAAGTMPAPRPGPAEPMENIRQKVQELSQTCVEGAAFLVGMCHDAVTRDILLPNMCILQSWVFAGGVVLGFCLLAPPDHGTNTNQELRKSFVKSREVLARFSKSSPQSQRYYDILTHFSAAVEAYEKQLRRARRQSNSPYVEQILRPETDSDDASSSPSPSPSGPGPEESSITVMPPAGDDHVEDQCATPGGTTAPGLASPMEQPGPMEGFVWSEQETNAQFAAEINDDLGLQLPWDEYASGFMQDFVPTPAGVYPQAPWTQFNNG